MAPVSAEEALCSVFSALLKLPLRRAAQEWLIAESAKAAATAAVGATRDDPLHHAAHLVDKASAATGRRYACGLDVQRAVAAAGDKGLAKRVRKQLVVRHAHAHPDLQLIPDVIDALQHTQEPEEEGSPGMDNDPAPSSSPMEDATRDPPSQQDDGDMVGADPAELMCPSMLMDDPAPSGSPAADVAPDPTDKGTEVPELLSSSAEDKQCSSTMPSQEELHDFLGSELANLGYVNTELAEDDQGIMVIISTTKAQELFPMIHNGAVHARIVARFGIQQAFVVVHSQLQAIGAAPRQRARHKVPRRG